MESVVETTASPGGEPPANPHVLWRQLLGLVLWLGVLGFLSGGPVPSVAALIFGGVTFADAWRSGIYKDRNRSSFLNMSPMAWGIVVPLFFILGYPLYLINRNRLRTRRAGNGFFIATIVIGAALFALYLYGVFVAARAAA